MPTGELSSLNPAGLAYYRDLIDALLKNGIEPVVIMYHWDLPQALQDIGGFLNPDFTEYFEDYADTLFGEFGDKVKNWATFNEPRLICSEGYGKAKMAPFLNTSVTGGEYKCAYHLLLAHARAYHLYNKKFRRGQNGHIGIVFDFSFIYPADGKDYTTADRTMQYDVGLYANPIFSKKGDWPAVIIDEVNKNSVQEGRIWSRLPKFDNETRKFVRGSADWFGLNYYTSYLVTADAKAADNKNGQTRDRAATTFKDEEWESSKTAPWIHNVPEGFRDAINYVSKAYNNPEIWITENGWGDDGKLKDESRVEYFKGHLTELLKTIKCNRLNVTRYYAWSLIDNFEWTKGYS